MNMGMVANNSSGTYPQKFLCLPILFNSGYSWETIILAIERRALRVKEKKRLGGLADALHKASY